MLGYAKLEKAKRNAQEVQAGRTSQDYAGLSALPTGVGNQAMLAMLESQRAQATAQPSSGGTPLADAVRAKFERQFGLSLDDVRIHRDSAEPAKFDAGAYTYGTDIFIAPGQEELLNHEMTHVAQQKLGQVRPTGMEHGMAVNRSPVLEHSADTGAVAQTMGTAAGPVVQCGPTSYEEALNAELEAWINPSHAFKHFDDYNEYRKSRNKRLINQLEYLRKVKKMKEKALAINKDSLVEAVTQTKNGEERTRYTIKSPKTNDNTNRVPKVIVLRNFDKKL